MSDLVENNDRVPFFPIDYSETKTQLGGAERHVSKVGFHGERDTHVLKEPEEKNWADILAEQFPSTNDSEKQAIEALSAYLNSAEYFANSKKNYDRMRDIFDGLLADTDFIIGNPREGNRQGFYILQRNVHGKTWSEFSRQSSPEYFDRWMQQHRKDLIKLIGGTRKVLIETGGAVDLHEDNIMIDEYENIVLIDPGTPSIITDKFDLVMELSPALRYFIANRILLNDIKQQDEWASKLGLTTQELQDMYSEADITEEQYSRAVEGIRGRCKRLLDH